jgi:hypothetical protein
MKEVKVTAGYCCPICTLQPNDNFFFYESHLIGQPICEDCNADFSYWVGTGKVEAKFIDQINKNTNISWKACRLILLENEINRLKAFEVEGFETWFEDTLKDRQWAREEALNSVRAKVIWLQERLRAVTD